MKWAMLGWVPPGGRVWCALFGFWAGLLSVGSGLVTFTVSVGVPDGFWWSGGKSSTQWRSTAWHWLNTPASIVTPPEVLIVVTSIWGQDDSFIYVCWAALAPVWTVSVTSNITTQTTTLSFTYTTAQENTAFALTPYLCEDRCKKLKGKERKKIKN